MSHTTESVAGRIDHTLLKPEAVWKQVARICEEAMVHRFASVCINPLFVPGVKQKLALSGVKTCTVVGFPLGANDLTVKRSEATIAVKQGAEEIDFVAHLPYLLNADGDAATAEFAGIVEAVRDTNPDVVVKVIIESAVLMKDVDAATGERRIAVACESAAAAGCDFVKTSTGFHPAGGATPEAVKLMRKHAGDLQVKAAGGVRDWDSAIAMIDAGADRLGCSAGVAIVTGSEGKASY